MSNADLEGLQLLRAASAELSDGAEAGSSESDGFPCSIHPSVYRDKLEGGQDSGAMVEGLAHVVWRFGLLAPKPNAQTLVDVAQLPRLACSMRESGP